MWYVINENIRQDLDIATDEDFMRNRSNRYHAELYQHPAKHNTS